MTENHLNIVLVVLCLLIRLIIGLNSVTDSTYEGCWPYYSLTIRGQTIHISGDLPSLQACRDECLTNAYPLFILSTEATRVCDCASFVANPIHQIEHFCTDATYLKNGISQGNYAVYSINGNGILTGESSTNGNSQSETSTDQTPQSETTTNGASQSGTTTNGASQSGTTTNGASQSGTNTNGASQSGTTTNGASQSGPTTDGASQSGSGTTTNGTPLVVPSQNGTSQCQSCDCPTQEITYLTFEDLTPEQQRQINELKKKLTLEKKELSSYIRTKTSANDDRPTAKGIGSIGLVILILCLGAMVVMDADKIITGSKKFYDIIKYGKHFFLRERFDTKVFILKDQNQNSINEN